MMAVAQAEALFMHGLPAHRGEVVIAEVIDGPQSVVWDEAENRLHVQKALMAYLLLGRIAVKALRRRPAQPEPGRLLAGRSRRQGAGQAGGFRKAS